MRGDPQGGFPPRDNEHSTVANPNNPARGREHQPGGAYEPEYGQDNRSWKDQSRSPSCRHQERDSSHEPGEYHELPGNYPTQHQQQYSSYPAKERSSSRDRGDYRPYRTVDRDRGRDRGYGHNHDRRDRDNSRYDDNYDEVGDRRLDYDDEDYHYSRDRPSSSRDRDYNPSRDYRDREDDRRGAPYRGRRDHDFPYRRGRTVSPHPGEPSETVLVEGIPPDIEEHDVNFGLNALQLAGLQEIRIRRERSSARRIAFLEFNSIQNAVAFIESYPDLTITLHFPHNAPVNSCRVRISYSWGRRDDSWKDWACVQCRANNYSSRYECYRCGEPKPRQDSVESEDIPILTGEKDACPNQKPYSILVITGLDGSTNEDVFSKGVMKLYLNNSEETSQQPTAASGLKTTAPVGNTKGLGARPGSLRRVFLVRDRKTRTSWRYGFAEFATIEDAVKAVAKFQASPRFTIASKPVTVDYIHTGVFVPVIPPEPQIPPYVFTALHNPAIYLRYWEYRAYANPHLVSTMPLVDAPSSDMGDGQGKKEKKRKAEKEAGGLKKKALAMTPQMQMWANKSAEIRGQSSNDTPIGDRRPIERETAPKTLDAPMAEAEAAMPKPERDPVWSYADPERICCLLCKRKFGSLEQLGKHEASSNLHVSNLKDAGKKEAATKALAAVGLVPTIVEGGPQYRDRAKERRVVHNQPSKPSQAPKRDHGKAEKKPAPEPASAPAPAPPKMSKGMAMLSKMGLKAGEGLGADGSGRKEIINTDLYRPGVGLGAEGAKIGDAGEEAARATKGDYGDFLKKTQEKARERFQNLGKD